MIKEYTVVTAKSLEYLIMTVNDRIKHGWTPLGGIFENGEVGNHYLQAMVLKE